MNITVIGGGPGGLYFAIQMKKADPSCQIDVYERNSRGSTFGWGVVFSDNTMENFKEADEKTYHAITDTFYHWDDIEVHFKGETVRSSGHGFCGISRQELLNILIARAEELDIQIHFDAQVESLEKFQSADFIVAADGIFSQTRDQLADHFKPDIVQRKCKYIWLGTDRPFPAFTFSFVENEHGWFQAHCYQFNETTSTFIVECPEDVWRSAGIDQMDKDEGVQYCEKLFADLLGGHTLRSNSKHLRGSAAWITFPQINCENWHYKNVVLLGDSSASAHFSIGSGTKLAMESAIALAQALSSSQDITRALHEYQETRRLEVLKLQNAARNSTEWFENVALKSKLKPEQFTYSLLTRSQRVSHENLRLRDKEYLEGVERWFAKEARRAASTQQGSSDTASATPPMFTPYSLRDMHLTNRIAVSPMATYSAEEGLINDFHLVHLGSRALGGAALIFTEMTCISPDARITPGCAGIYTDEHVAAWKRVTDFVHAQSSARVALQLGHAGRKGSTKVGWEGMDEPLESDNWPLFAPSPIPYTSQNQIPLEMADADFQRIKNDFVEATQRAEKAGFDMLELHCAHGYLLSTFISPLTNTRTDSYGGSLENRLRFPLEVFEAMRSVWSDSKPMSVRISATDWAQGGITAEDAVEIARAFSSSGADIIDVSAGQVTPDQKPVYGRMFQTPFADKIRAEADIATMAVGNIYETDHVNSILASGRADLCLLARPHLSDPHWTLNAAAELDYENQEWPKQYLAGKQQLYTLTRRAKAMQTNA